MEVNEILKALLPFVSVLDGLEIPYYIGGSIASSVFGLPRSTMDIDIVADIRESHVNELTAILQNEYYIDKDVVLRAIARKSSFNIIHFETMMKIDVFALKSRSFDRSAFNRKKTDILGEDPGGRKFYFSSAEDIIISKLEWFKLGGKVSERQWKDIIGVLKVQEGALDYGYLEKWSEEMRVLDLLKKALKEIR
jgi:hypothetical protein